MSTRSPLLYMGIFYCLRCSFGPQKTKFEIKHMHYKNINLKIPSFLCPCNRASKIKCSLARHDIQAQSCLLVLSFFKAKRSQYYGKFEANFSIYIGQMSFHIRRINFICFYIRYCTLFYCYEHLANCSLGFLFCFSNSSVYKTAPLSFLKI